MKKMFAVFAVLILAAMAFVACGSDSGGGAPAPTAVTTQQQGAQAATVGTSAAVNVARGSVELSGIVGGGPIGASRFSANSLGSKSLARVVGNAMTKVKKAKAAATVKAPQTMNCTDGGTITIDTDGASVYTITSANCKEGGYLTNGTMQMTISGTTLTMSINQTETDYGSSNYTVAETIEITNETISMTESGTTTVTISITGTDSYEDKTSVPPYKDESSFNATLTGTDNTDYTNVDVNNDPVAGDISMKLNGTISEKHYASGTLTDSSNESFGNFVVTDTWNNTTGAETLSINGTYTVDLFPDDACAEGTYSFVTNTPIVYNFNTGAFSAGEIEINGNVVVKFSSTGVQVSIDGGTTFTSYTEADFNNLCPNI